MNPPVVAIHDSGVDPLHPRLASALTPGRSFDTRIPNPFPDATECHHGTLAALVLREVAPAAKLLPIRYSGTSPERLAVSLEYATAHADVVLCAWGLASVTPRLATAFANSRALVVASTGPGVGYPACLPTVLPVSDGPRSDGRV